MIKHPAAVRRTGFFTAIAIAAVAAAFVSSAAQAASCASRTLTSPFSKFGDTNQYFLAPSGSFESGASGWALSNAAIASGNDSFHLELDERQELAQADRLRVEPGVLHHARRSAAALHGEDGHVARLERQLQPAERLDHRQERGRLTGQLLPWCGPASGQRRLVRPASDAVREPLRLVPLRGQTASARPPCRSSWRSRARAVPGTSTTSTSIRSPASRRSHLAPLPAAPGAAGAHELLGASPFSAVRCSAQRQLCPDDGSGSDGALELEAVRRAPRPGRRVRGFPEPSARFAPPPPLSRISTVTVSPVVDSSTRASDAPACLAALVRVSATT